MEVRPSDVGLDFSATNPGGPSYKEFTISLDETDDE
jgi:hypothetical protein